MAQKSRPVKCDWVRHSVKKGARYLVNRFICRDQLAFMGRVEKQWFRVTTYPCEGKSLIHHLFVDSFHDLVYTLITLR